MKFKILLIFMLMMSISLAAEPKIDPTQINWSENISSKIIGVTNGTAAQDVVTYSQLDAVIQEDGYPKLTYLTYTKASSDYATGSESFVVVDGNNLNLSFTSHGYPIIVTVSGLVVYNSAAVSSYIDVAINGTSIGGASAGVLTSNFADAGVGTPMSIVLPAGVLPAGNHYMELRYKTGTGGATYIRKDFKIMMSVLEVKN